MSTDQLGLVGDCVVGGCLLVTVGMFLRHLRLEANKIDIVTSRFVKAIEAIEKRVTDAMSDVADRVEASNQRVETSLRDVARDMIAGRESAVLRMESQIRDLRDGPRRPA